MHYFFKVSAGEAILEGFKRVQAEDAIIKGLSWG
jgi:hypothetical protein